MGKEEECLSAKINLQYLISLFELHLSYGAAASNQDSVNIQRVVFYYLRLCVLFYFILKYQVHVRSGDTEVERRMKDKCEGRKERDRVGNKERGRVRRRGSYT